MCLCFQDWGFVLCSVLLPPPLYPFLLLCGQTWTTKLWCQPEAGHGTTKVGPAKSVSLCCQGGLQKPPRVSPVSPDVRRERAP